MSLEVRLLRESEYKAANDFYNSTSHINRKAPAVPRTFDEFFWEFGKCVYGKIIYAGAWELEDGKEPVLVGMQCFIPLKLIAAGGKEVLCAKGEATLIDAKALIRYKKTDILGEMFKILLEECTKAGVEFLWGFNVIPATYKRLGFESPFQSNNGMQVLKPFKAFREIASQRSKKTLAEQLKIAAGVALSFLLSLKKITVPALSADNHLNNSLDANDIFFQEKAGIDKMYFLKQNADYLKWKISENPYPIHYKSYQFTDASHAMVAQIICSIQKERACIEQVLFEKKINRRQRQVFLKKVLKLIAKENVCMVRYTGFENNKMNAEEVNLFKSLGFVFTGKGEWFTFKKISAGSRINPENIYLSRMYKQGIN